MELRVVSPISGRKMEEWALNFMLANKIIAIQKAKIKDRQKVLQLLYQLNSTCELGLPSIDEKGQLCVDFKSEKHKSVFILKYSDRSVWLPAGLK